MAQDPDLEAYGAKLQAGFAAKFPSLAAAPVPTRKRDFTIVTLGQDQDGKRVALEETPRLEHMHVIGTTGSGKTTFLKNLALQDFRRGRGGMVFDPHGSHPGSLYHELVSDLDESGFFKTGRVHLIDPNVRSHLVPFNPLARIPDTDLSVLADALLQAFERAWGDEDTHAKPTIRSVLKATFMALAELGLPLTDAKLLYDPHDSYGVRRRVLSQLTNEYARDELARLHQTSQDERSKHDFRAEVVGPINRLNEFVSSDAIRAMLGIVDEVGAPRRTLDLLDIMNKGHIVLVNLQHGGAVSEADTELLGAILLRYVFLLASRRYNLEPFFLYVDECHRYLTGDVPNILAETRKYGIASTLAHQFEAQLGKREELIYQALVNSTEIKAVFRVKSPEEAQRLAEMVIPLDLEQPVAASVRPTAVGQRPVQLQSRARSVHEAEGEGVADTEAQMEASTMSSASVVGSVAGSSIGTNELASQVFAPTATLFGPNAPNAAIMPVMLSQSAAAGSSQSDSSADSRSEMSGESYTLGVSRAATRSKSRMHGVSESEGWHEGFETIYANLPAAYHSKENVLYMAGELLRSLPVGKAYVAWRGKSACVTIPPPKRKS